MGLTSDWDQLVQHVKREKSDFLLLPEMTFFPWFAVSPKFDPRIWDEAVEAHRKWLKRLPETSPAIVAGSSPVYRKGKRLNQGFIWTPEGGIGWVHTKSYLPNDRWYWEASWYDRGDRKFIPVQMPGYKLGFMICTDMWAMPYARSYGRQGVSLLVVPRVTEMLTTEKWLAGGKVAAMISGAFSISSNRAVKAGSGIFGGNGWVIGPDGEVIGLTSSRRRFLTVDIDLEKAERAKKTYPRDSLEPD
jgi:N-carbamoylputrescine amidase